MDKTVLRNRIRLHPLYKSVDEVFASDLAQSLSSKKRLINHWKDFCAWSITQDKNQLQSINAVTRCHVIRYGRYLKNEFDAGRFSSTITPISHLSGVCVLLDLLQPGWGKVSPSNDCDLRSFSLIPNKKPVLDKNGLPDTESLAGYLLELQISLGVTIGEALIMDLKAALIEGRSTGFVTVTHFQNGFRRKVPCRPSAIKAIGSGIAARRLQKLLPKKWEFDDFVAAHNKLAARKCYSTNTARSVYARNRYQELTCVEPPILSGLGQAEHWERISQHSNKTLSEAKGIDKNTRHQIAKEIGVLGIEPLKDYLDKNHHSKIRDL